MADSLEDDVSKIVLAPVTRKKGAKNKIINVSRGVVHVHATFNNTKVTVSDTAGNALTWSSGGKQGFKGSRKSTAYAAQIVAIEACKRAMAAYGLREVEVQIKGPGAGRESAVRGVVAAGLEVSQLRDVTPVPHNGCRPPKRRRV
jgi:small subunit ribosomal protein S11